jgi:hypothetical protein
MPPAAFATSSSLPSDGKKFFCFLKHFQIHCLNVVLLLKNMIEFFNIVF